MLEIYRYLPLKLLGKDVEEMEMEEFYDAWAKARHIQELEKTLFQNAIVDAISGGEKQ
jgi:hypothetical protein